jgi:PKD repeat protein
MTYACDFDASTEGIISAGSFRFFPRVSGFSKPIASWTWVWGDGTTDGTDECPVHAYPTVVARTSYDVTLTVVDVDSNTATITKDDFVTLAPTPALAFPENFHAASVFISDGTNSMVVNRRAWTYCHLMVNNITTNDPLDKIGTAKFTIVDKGDSSATEKSLIAEGMSVVVFMGQAITFSGRIRRCTSLIQNQYLDSTRVRIWEVECDSDLAKLSSVNIDSAALTAAGTYQFDTPGNLARIILTPSTGVKDTRGIIDCTGVKVEFQLNSLTSAESAGDQYSKIMTLQASTNYDLRTRPDCAVYEFDRYYYVDLGASSKHVFKFDTLDPFVADEWNGGYIFLVDPYYGNGTTINRDGIIAFGKIDDTGTDNIVSNVGSFVMVTGSLTSTLIGTVANPPLVILYRGYLVDFAPDLSQPSVIKDYGINTDAFSYLDNDDKRKLATKVVVQGKDLQGVTISVAIAAPHEFDNTTQMFKDSTTITQKTEGTFFKNSYLNTDIQYPCEIRTGFTGFTFVTYTSSAAVDVYGTDVQYACGVRSKFTVHKGSGTLGTNMTDGEVFYVYSRQYVSANQIRITLGHYPYSTSAQVFGASSGTVTADNERSVEIDNTNDWIYTGGRMMFATQGGTMPADLNVYDVYDGCFNQGSNYDDHACLIAPDAAWTTPGTNMYIYKATAVNSVCGSADLGVPLILLYGWGFVIPVGTDMILVKPGATPISVTTVKATEESREGGVRYTKVYIDEVLTELYDGSVFLLGEKFYVKDASKVGTNEVLIGEELATIASTGTDTTYGDYIVVDDLTGRVSTTSLKCYPHGSGCLVARTNYTEASPQTDSPIDKYGLYISTRTVDSGVTYGLLDMYASHLLLGLGIFYKKGTCLGPTKKLYVYEVNGYCEKGVFVPPTAGDRVSFTEYTGATPEEFQIVSVSINHDTQMVNLEMGDFEKNVFTSLGQSTNAINKTLT